MKQRIKHAGQKISIHRKFSSNEDFEALKQKLRERGHVIMSSALHKDGRGYIYAYSYVDWKSV